MLVTFEKSYLRELFEDGRSSDKKHRFQPQIIKGYQRRIEMLMSASSPEVLYTINSLNFEALSGQKQGLYSIRVNNQYRIEFSLVSTSESQSINICNIVELSNHYQ